MKEVEIKARLIDRDAVMKKLSEKGCIFSDPITQNDKVFVRSVGPVETYRSNDVYLRIRVKKGTKTIFTLKKPLLNDLDVIEHETEIASGDALEKALLLMGYSLALHIDKTRVTTSWEGKEICLDDVEGLGSFIEMESLAEEMDSEKAQSEMFEFFKEIGIREEDRVLEGYDTLLVRKQHG